ncbi:MAG TPA: SAV_915 family protein [Streptosporangiaceae bacterium]|jgi:hypothetical protein|nr:SAV_915 family protein [Streptosporangiaceae bacterium]
MIETRGADGRERHGQEELGLPEIVIAPAHPADADGQKYIQFEPREDARGSAVLPVFSSVRKLTQSLGTAQPWVALPLHKVRELAAAGQVHTVVIDPDVDLAAWRWSVRDLESLEETMEEGAW